MNPPEMERPESLQARLVSAARFLRSQGKGDLAEAVMDARVLIPAGELDEELLSFERAIRAEGSFSQDTSHASYVEQLAAACERTMPAGIPEVEAHVKRLREIAAALLKDTQ